MIKISIQFFGGRGGSGGKGGGGGKLSLSDETTLSGKDLVLKYGNIMGPKLLATKQQIGKLNNVGDYIEVTKTMKDGSVEVSRMTLTGFKKHNDVYTSQPDAKNPNLLSITTEVPGWRTRTDAGINMVHEATLTDAILDKRTRVKSVTVKTYTKG